MAHVNSVISVTLLISFVHHGVCESTTTDLTDSDEDSALKEALLLVDILKSAYVKVLQENNDLRAGPNTIADLSTCPTTTTIKQSFTSISKVSTIGPISQMTSSRTEQAVARENLLYNWSPPSFHSSNRRNYRGYPPMYYRRYMNIPSDYYYYDFDKFRRFEYEDPFGAHPNETATKGEVTHKETTLFSDVTPVSAHKAIADKTNTITPASLPKAKRIPSHNEPISLNKAKRVTLRSIEDIHKLKLMLPLPGESTSSTADPVISQVASELIHEFGSGPSTIFRPKHINIIKSPKNIKLGMMREWWRQPDLPRTTVRIHLSRSSKFHIPYPDNHAFCYTNPENALCHTLIK